MVTTASSFVALIVDLMRKLREAESVKALDLLPKLISKERCWITPARMNRITRVISQPKGIRFLFYVSPGSPSETRNVKLQAALLPWSIFIGFSFKFENIAIREYSYSGIVRFEGIFIGKYWNPRIFSLENDEIREYFNWKIIKSGNILIGEYWHLKIFKYIRIWEY